MTDLICPGCGEKVALEDLKVGDRLDCPHCANLTLKLAEKNGLLHLVEVPKVSCPSCGRVMEIPEGLGAGDRLKCCGEELMLTYEFGAYALQRNPASR